MPNIWWEPGWEDFEEYDRDRDIEAQNWISEHGIEEDPELPFN